MADDAAFFDAMINLIPAKHYLEPDEREKQSRWERSQQRKKTPAAVKELAAAKQAGKRARLDPTADAALPVTVQQVKKQEAERTRIATIGGQKPPQPQSKPAVAAAAAAAAAAARPGQPKGKQQPQATTAGRVAQKRTYDSDEEEDSDDNDDDNVSDDENRSQDLLIASQRALSNGKHQSAHPSSGANGSNDNDDDDDDDSDSDDDEPAPRPTLAKQQAQQKQQQQHQQQQQQQQQQKRTQSVTKPVAQQRSSQPAAQHADKPTAQTDKPVVASAAEALAAASSSAPASATAGESPSISVLRQRLHERLGSIRSKRKADETHENAKKRARLEKEKAAAGENKKAAAPAAAKVAAAAAAGAGAAAGASNGAANARPTTADGSVVFSKFDFSSLEQEKKRKSKVIGGTIINPHGKDYKKLIERAEQHKKQVDELKSTDATKAAEIEQKEAWQKAMAKAEGTKVKDDLKMMKRSLKQKEKQKLKSSVEWKERERGVKASQAKRQEQRNRNLAERHEHKKFGNKGKGGKGSKSPGKGGKPSNGKPKKRPGFEGK